ncbi:MAG: succinate dehydrogenase cytochrome b subunit [Planctomycetes bacterium]|nr:succinate dehydrogenase cytochrome b subunit [Planctomycetota bacterium]
MSWLSNYLSSSIGRKQLMAVTGLMLCGFLIVHLLGNFTLFAGYSTETIDGKIVEVCAFNKYAHALTANKAILFLAELILLAIFGSHIYLALTLSLENRAARGNVRYDVNAKAGPMTLSSATMPYTGSWILLFLVLHVATFRFTDHTSIEMGLYGLVSDTFQNPLWTIFYIVSLFLVAAHVKHGFQSCLQTIGFNHPKYNGMIQTVSTVYAIFIFVGFSSIPLWFIFTR